MSDLNSNRPSGFQTLYDAMGIPQQDQETFDQFCGELETKLIEASDREHQLRSTNGNPSTRNTSAHRSTSDNPHEAIRSRPVFPPDDISPHLSMPSLRRNAIAPANLSGSEPGSDPATPPEDFTASDDTVMTEDYNPDEQPLPSGRSPLPNSWAALKPANVDPLHFPGHANYRDFETPVTGAHGFLLLHRRPHFLPGPRHTTSRDGQPLDQHAMTTLHYTTNTSPSIQTHTYRHRDAVDFTNRNDIRKLEYWTKAFLAGHGVRARRGEAVPYDDAERAWIRDLFAAEPGLSLSELAVRYNAYWKGRELGGTVRPGRTPGALSNEVYRSNLKKRAYLNGGNPGPEGKRGGAGV